MDAETSSALATPQFCWGLSGGADGGAGGQVFEDVVVIVVPGQEAEVFIHAFDLDEEAEVGGAAGE